MPEKVKNEKEGIRQKWERPDIPTRRAGGLSP